MKVLLKVLLFPVAFVWVLRWKLAVLVAGWWAFGWVIYRM